jgi:hypothetical protein
MPEPVRVKNPPMYLNSGVLCRTASACVKDLHKSQSKSRHVPADCRHMVWSRCIVDQPRQAEFRITLQKLARVNPGSLVCEYVRFDVSYGSLRLVLDTVVECLQDILFETGCTRERLHDRVAVRVREAGVVASRRFCPSRSRSFNTVKRPCNCAWFSLQKSNCCR